jgi:hypothetical protein
MQRTKRLSREYGPTFSIYKTPRGWNCLEKWKYPRRQRTVRLNSWDSAFAHVTSIYARWKERQELRFTAHKRLESFCGDIETPPPVPSGHWDWRGFHPTEPAATMDSSVTEPAAEPTQSSNPEPMAHAKPIQPGC